MKFRRGEMGRSFAIIVISLVGLIKGSESQVVRNSSKGESVQVVEEIKMRWCGSDELPRQGFTNTTQIVFDRKNFMVTFEPGSLICPPGVNSSPFTMNMNRSTRNRGLYPSHFAPNGYFRAGAYYYSPEEYCVDKLNEKDITVNVCGEFKTTEENSKPKWSYPECALRNPCLPKCCFMNRFVTLSSNSYSCLAPFNSSAEFNPFIYSTVSSKSSATKPVQYFKNALQHCGNETVYMIHQANKLHQYYSNVLRQCFRLQEDGTLFYLDHKYIWVKIPMGDYCMDGVQINGSNANLPVEAFLGEERHYIVRVCALALPIEAAEDDGTVYDIFYGATSVVASIFLLLTFVVYALLWKEQKIQGWTTMSHSGTMFFMYLFLAAKHFMELGTKASGRIEGPSLCMVAGIFWHFFFVSTFCWLTVVCFHLFWTFRTLTTGNPHAKMIGQYVAYALFGWGFPFMFVTASVIIEREYRYEPCNEVPVPGYGEFSCTLSFRGAGPYQYYPVGTLLILNMILCSITAYKLYTYRKSTSMARENVDKSVEMKESFQLFAKLFLVMGFTWIFELVSWLHAGSERKWYWVITDIFNILQGVAIFVIYICKANIVTSLAKNYPELRPLLSIPTRFAGKSVRIREAESSGATNAVSVSMSEVGQTSVRLNSLNQIQQQ